MTTGWGGGVYISAVLPPYVTLYVTEIWLRTSLKMFRCIRSVGRYKPNEILRAS
jgi:hypothetical protein